MAHAAPEDTQVNSRINKTIKQEGDAIFAAIGVTPSQAIRGLYEFAVEHRNEPEKVARVIKFNELAEERAQKERESKLQALDNIRAQIDAFRAGLGLEDTVWQDIRDSKPVEDLGEELRLQHAIEKGWVTP